MFFDENSKVGCKHASSFPCPGFMPVLDLLQKVLLRLNLNVSFILPDNELLLIRLDSRQGILWADGRGRKSSKASKGRTAAAVVGLRTRRQQHRRQARSNHFRSKQKKSFVQLLT